MFHPIGLFKKIPCPRQHDCLLQNCVFDHNVAVQSSREAGDAAYDPFSAGEVEPPAPKRRRVDSLDPENRPSSSVDRSNQNSVTLNPRPPKVPKLHHGPKPGNLNQSINASNNSLKPDAHTAEPTPEVSRTKTLPSGSSTVTKQPTTIVKAHKENVPAKVENLVPRPVSRAPAVLKVRLSLIEMIQKQMSALNSQVKEGGTEFQHLVLSDQQIITMVLDEEEQAATKLSNDIYRNAMSQRILQLRRMKAEDWRGFIGEKTNSLNPEKETSDPVESGLSVNQEVQVLKYLRTNLTGLDAHGYVTKPPIVADIQKAKEAIRTSGGYEVCDRCGTRFQAFPGRDEQGRLTTKGECHYHWAKLNRAQWQRTDHITGQAQSSYSCCNRPPGSEGCTQAPTHVFKVTDSKRLAALWQFESTTTKTDGKKRGPIAFDCEMAYTSYGMELIRVTAVSWPQNREVLDVLVRPFGEILDLNTRFSGVSKEQYAAALPYGEIREHKDDTSEEGEVELEPLRKVGSPSAARQLLSELLTPETPLIGHAIDNDLNACRIIHPFVIDTVLLYPHPKALPVRYGLKALTSKHLHRSIQTGGAAGHDSKEDSIATGDLVRVKVAEKWQMMRLQGWKFGDESLVPPGR